MRAVRPAASIFRRSPTALAVAMALAPLPTMATTYTVTNNADSGAGSLRDAITQANALCGSDPAPVIQFNIPASFTIAPSSPLPIMSCGTGAYNPTIDGYSQPGSSANTSSTGFNATIPIVIDGTNVQFGCGLEFDDFGYGGNLTVKGLDVRNFTYGGFGEGLCGKVQLYGNRVSNNSYGAAVQTSSVIGSTATADRNVFGSNSVYGIDVAYGGTVDIVNNFIGTLDGSTASPNDVGIFWPSPPDAGTIVGNTVSGNTTAGISITGGMVTSITNNRIGTDSTGSVALGNGTGLEISGSPLIGGGSIDNNVISGNSLTGVSADGLTSVQFTSNIIGLSTSGAAMSNGVGLSLSCSDGLTIASNTIAGNSAEGLTLTGVDNSTIQGNYIGVDSALTPMPNDYGIVFDGQGSCIQTDSNNLIQSNFIDFNNSDGILLLGGTGNGIHVNSIHGNGNKNIDIGGGAGPLPNDPGDADTGANNQQNYPVITSVTQSAGNTIIRWTLDSTPSDGFLLEFFANTAPGIPAGETFIGNTNVSPGVTSGISSFAGLYDNISATASDTTTLDTSEFSPMVAVTPTPAASVVPSALSFGNVAIGSTSPPQTSTITSDGNLPYQINSFDTSALCYGGSLCYGGPFICTTTCATSPATYSTGQSCTVSASFAPNVTGPQSSTIYICDNTAASPHTITLSGTGVVPPPLTWTPSSYNFGSVLVGSSGTNQFFLSNPGTSPVTFSPPATTGPFAVTASDCGTSLAAGSHCSATVAFSPTFGGSASGTLCASTVCAPLSGTGAFVASIQLPASIDLGAYTIGAPPVSQTITITNNGNAVVTFSSITVSTPFALQNGCPLNLQPGASCTVTVMFSGTQDGVFTGTLTVVSNAAGGSRAIPVTVNALPVPVPLIRVSSAAIGFGDRVIGLASPSQRVTISNVGTAAATLSLNLTTVDFLIGGTSCGLTLAPASSCFADIAMRPIGFGLRSGQLVITSNAASSPDHVDLGGTGCRPFMPSGNRLGQGTRNNCAP